MNISSDSVSPEKTNYKFFAFNILKTKGKSLFQENKAMECLAKSDAFFKELLNTLSRLYFNNISPKKFIEIVQDFETSKTDTERLLLVGKLYEIYVKIMQDNDFAIPAFFSSSKLFINNHSNTVIQKRIQHILSSFNSDAVESFNNIDETLPHENISYLEFSDIQNETSYIIDEIKSIVSQKKAEFSEIAVFIDKTEARKKFLDLIKAQELPVISSIYDENYENLKNKISLYHKISDLFLELSLNEFSYDAIKNTKISSKAQKEICFEQLDEIFKNILIGIIQTPKTIDNLLTKTLNNKNNILETIFSSWQTLNEIDKNCLATEFNEIKTFYAAYKKQNYAEAISSILKRHLAKFEEKQIKDAVLGKIKSLNDLDKLFETLNDTNPEFDSFEEIIQGLPQDKEKAKNEIYLASITTEQPKKNNFKYVYIAGLTCNNYPSQNKAYPFISLQANNLLTEQIRKISPNFEYFLTTDNIYFEQRLNDFCKKMSLAEIKVTLTTHKYEAKKQTQPSVFFKILCDKDCKNFTKINKEEHTAINQSIKKTKISTTNSNNTPIIDNEDCIKLNPSAINTFQKCQKKYYYKHLLNLKEPYNFSANYGSIVHAVFQILNTNFKHNYSQKMAFALAKVLFDSAEDEDRAIQAGFTQTDIDLVKACPKLSLEEMKNNFIEALDDFSLSGGFDNPPVTSTCEQAFSFKLKEIPNVIFDGRIDAILTTADGYTKVVDYKTGKNKTNTLDYAISDYGVNFKLKTGKDPSNIETLQKAYDYQIPLYYLACQNSSELVEYKDKITTLGLTYIRPKSKDNGCNDDFISAERLEEYKDKIIQNLKDTVINKIINETEFPKTKSWDCEDCAYNFLCKQEDE